jgi:hypothetical protein
VLHLNEPSTKLPMLKSRLAGMRVLAKFDAFVRAFEQRYDPDHPQPRDSRGRWTDSTGVRNLPVIELAARSRRRSGFEDDCEAQYARDTFHCTMVGLQSCHRQAAIRYAACLKGDPVPPLNY